MEQIVAMNGGDGLNSYTRNSSFQAAASDLAKQLLTKSIAENLIILKSCNLIRIADLGCSVGPNTFTCVQTIIEAIQQKLESLGLLGSGIPEFQVFFNDTDNNDFNTLFKGLPSQRSYMAAGAPGSFFGRLFPENSMNFMHSSIAFHWLSKIPDEVTTEGSPSWNKGNITYAGSSEKVIEAFRAQSFKDMDAFFKARSIELVNDGLLAILIPCRDDDTHPEVSIMHFYGWLGHALYDMANEGLVSEALVDSFNLPVFLPSPSEVKQAVSANHELTIEVLEQISHPLRNRADLGNVKEFVVGTRAIYEGILIKHFGSAIIDELFVRYAQKWENFKIPLYGNFNEVKNLFLLVKRN
ncbi:hypothetical protein ACFE04_016972 [Oxalis oulophora]